MKLYALVTVTKKQAVKRPRIVTTRAWPVDEATVDVVAGIVQAEINEIKQEYPNASRAQFFLQGHDGAATALETITL